MFVSWFFVNDDMKNKYIKFHQKSTTQKKNAVAVCVECPFESHLGYPAAVTQANQHVQSKGHKVRVVIEETKIINPIPKA